MARTNHRFTEAGPNLPFGTAPAASVLAPLFYSICMWCGNSAYRPFVSSAAMKTWQFIQIGWIVTWVATVLFCFLASADARQRGQWLSANARWIEVGALLGVQSGLWILFPHGSEGLRFLTIMASMAYIIIAVMITPEGIIINNIISTSVIFSIVIHIWFGDQFYWEFSTIILIAFWGVIYILGRVYNNSVSAIRQARDLAEMQLEARTRFLASASHDLGQPLQAARLFFDQASRGASESQRAAAYRNADNALSAMDRQLRYMLDHVRLTSQAVTARAEHARLDRILGSVFAQFEPVAELAGVTMQTAETSRSAWIDAGLLERALGNLIDNALRHADASRLLIGVHGNRIWVIDNGRGVPAEERSQLFTEFTQGRRHQTRERGGFGLGLASTHRLMELMGGNAGHESRWVNGSAFFLEMPRHAIVTIPP